MSQSRSYYIESDIPSLDDKINDIVKKSLNKIKMKKKYKVLKLNELADQLGLPPSNGYKTKDYLELTIHEIEDRGYGFIQFLQIVDALYVIIDLSEKNVSSGPDKFEPEKEIQNHYNPPRPIPKINSPEEVKVENYAPEKALEDVKKRDILDKKMKVADLPWKK